MQKYRIMACSHCTRTGTGQEQGTEPIQEETMGPGSFPILDQYKHLCTIYWDPLVKVPFPVPIPVPCSVNEPLGLFLIHFVTTYLSLQVGVLRNVLQFVHELVLPDRGPGVPSGVSSRHGPGRWRDQPPCLLGILARPRLGPRPRLHFLYELWVVCRRGFCPQCHG